MIRSRIASALILVGSLIASLAPGGLPAMVRAAEYTLETGATYTVLPADRRIDVSVEVTFTNTTPDPEGQFSVFDEVKLAVHDQAVQAAASDAEGGLDVALAVENDVNVATISLRDPLRYEETASFTLTYQLPDGEGPGLRVRPSLVVFPAWGFGTASEVRVELPPGFEVRVDGDPLTVQDGALVSGPIEDPSQWLALVTALGETEFVSVSAAVPLQGGTADLEVRAFADDEAWGQRTLALAEEALPLIEAEIGLPYPRLAPLVVTQSVSADASGFGETSDGSELLVAFDQPPFTTIHQLAHVWLTPALVDARWIREGMASDIGARVAEQIGVELPYDPAEAEAARADAAFALDEWSADAGPAGEAYGYAAAWAFMDELTVRTGSTAVQEVLRRVVAGIGPYERADVAPAPSAADVASPPAPLTSRGFLDHLETVTEVDLDDAFAERVFGEADLALLEPRAQARVALASLQSTAGDWGAPEPVLGAMTAWNFVEAEAQIAAAAEWLDDRDVLLEDMAEVGLSAPDRLRQAYRSYGGGAEAMAELDAQRSVVDAYGAAAERVNAERSFLERVGLAGGPDPAAELALANGRFADGDLTGAVAAIAEVERLLSAAETGGLVRVASAALIAVILLVFAALLYRRRASYTAAP